MSIKNLKDERGFTHILVVVLAVIVIAAIGAVGYRLTMSKKPASANTGNSSSSSNTSTSSSSNGESASCLATYHDANLCHFSSFASDFSKTAYTANLTESQSGTAYTMTLESDGKGNTSLSGNSGGSQINTIELNGVTYLESGGTWLEYPAGSSSSSAAAAANPTSDMNIGLGSGITYKNLGTAACGSLTCYKYQVTDSSMPSSTQYVWFDTSSYKLREWQSTSGSTGMVTMTVNYQPVTITKPSPVQVIST